MMSGPRLAIAAIRTSLSTVVRYSITNRYLSWRLLNGVASASSSTWRYAGETPQNHIVMVARSRGVPDGDPMVPNIPTMPIIASRRMGRGLFIAARPFRQTRRRIQAVTAGERYPQCDPDAALDAPR